MKFFDRFDLVKLTLWLMCSQVLFICLKLANVIKVSWWKIFVPLMIASPVLLALSATALIFFLAMLQGRRTSRNLQGTRKINI